MIKLEQASTIACSPSAMLEQHGSTRSSRLARHVERVESCLDVTRQVEFGLYKNLLTGDQTLWRLHLRHLSSAAEI